MNINFRDSKGNLYSKNILDIELNMKITKLESGKYVVNLNGKYVFDKEFNTKKEAEEQLRRLSDARNTLENELRNEV